MSGYHPSDGRHRLRFDDASHRLLNMRGKQFTWLAPRSRAAGYSGRLHAAMVHLGAGNVAPQPAPVPPPASLPALPPPGARASDQPLAPSAELPPMFGSCQLPAAEDAVGRTLCLFWRGDGQWYPGEVLAFDEEAGLHKVLFCDGEEEWVDLKAERLAWAQPGAAALAAGVCPGEDARRVGKRLGTAMGGCSA